MVVYTTPKGQLLVVAVKSRRTQYLGTAGFDTALMAGPYTAWPDMGWFWTNFPSNASSAAFYHIRGQEDLEISSGHPWRKLGNDSRDIGGEFSSYRQSYSQSPALVSYDISQTSNPNQTGYHYRGPQFAMYSQRDVGGWPEPPRSSFTALKTAGTSAIARVLPTNPVFDLATFIGELREGIPRLVGADFFKHRTEVARSAGSEYLNVEFGWRPLLNDVQSFAYAVRNHDEILAQYERDSGKRLRRRVVTLNETTSETTTVGTGSSAKPTPGLPSACVNSYANVVLTRTRTIKRKQWFSGCFTYYLQPERSGIEGRKRWLQEANKLYGVRLAPETLWNLTPWSWGVDWFVNVGDVLHNVSAFANDGLVMPYGYMMEQCSIEDQYTNSGNSYKTPGIPTSFSQTFTTTSKQRVRATPFGFGLNPDIDFTDRQWAIVSALGLSRGGSWF
jgi:hypothetical protein